MFRKPILNCLPAPVPELLEPEMGLDRGISTPIQRIQSSRRKCARAVAMGWERDFCQAVIITLATRLPWRVSRHSAYAVVLATDAAS